MSSLSILQWNICGYRAKYGELKKLLSDLSPACICLQETMLGNFNPKPPASYTLLLDNNDQQMATPGHGLGILIHTSIPYTKLTLRTHLQACAIQANLNQLITICNIYIGPQTRFSDQDIEDIISELPEPFLIVGDVNAKNALWGDTITDNRGRDLEDVILNNNISILNTGSPTHLHIQTGTFHAIDLSLCSPTLLTVTEWRTLEDLHGSDHFPIVISFPNQSLPDRPSRYNIKRANWADFYNSTSFYEDNNNLPMQEILFLTSTYPKCC